jgi:phage shock protein A
MQRLRIWTASLLSRVDGMVTRIENHEALAESAVREVRRASARAAVQLRRVRRDGERLVARLAEARDEALAWRERARRTVGDEDTALECLRRSRRCERLADELAGRVREHEAAERQLAADVSAVQERLEKLEAQRHVLVTRQSRATALAGVRDAGSPVGAEVDDIFDRWEARIAENELAGGCFDSGDALAERFDREEETEALRAELEALRRE